MARAARWQRAHSRESDGEVLATRETDGEFPRFTFSGDGAYLANFVSAPIKYWPGQFSAGDNKLWPKYTLDSTSFIVICTVHINWS
jgi:hypothetical protein